MDRALTFSAFVVAALHLTCSSPAEAASNLVPIERTANYNGQSGGSNTGPTAAPTITAQGADRYATQPTANWQTGTQPQTIPQRAQNGLSGTTNSLRDGLSAGTQGAAQQFQN